MVRINWLIELGRLEVYIGRNPHGLPDWRTDRITYGRGLWLGRWTFFACWLPKPTPYAEVREALLALADPEEAEPMWPARATP